MQITIYTKKACAYCNYAKKLLRENLIPYTELVLDEDFTRQQIKDNFPTAQTYPVIVMDGMYIGGYAQLKEELMKNNGSEKLLIENYGDYNGNF